MGVPHELRAQVWPLLIAGRKARKSSGRSSSKTRGDSPHKQKKDDEEDDMKLLRRDLNRINSCGPNSVQLISERICNYLVSIFNRIFEKQPTFRYAQGQLEIAVAAVTVFHPEVLDENTTSNTTSHTTTRKQDDEMFNVVSYLLTDALGPHVSESSETSRAAIDLFGELLQLEEPQLAQHLLNNEVTPLLYAPDWFQGFFRFLPFENVCIFLLLSFLNIVTLLYKYYLTTFIHPSFPSFYSSITF